MFNDQDNFTISANSGNDSIVNSGSNVSIYDYSGNDTICIVPNGTVYAQNVSIDAGAGDDLIINEFTGADYLTGTADSNAHPKTYLFGAGYGNDTIYFFGANDSIFCKDNTYYLGSFIDGADDKDIILNFSNNANATRPTSTILLKGCANAQHSNTFNIVNYGETSVTVYHAVTCIIGTADTDETFTNSYNYASIYADSGNDTISNSGDYVTIIGGVGNDSIVNSGSNVYISGGYGSNTISLGGSAANCTVSGGGHSSQYDLIYNNGAGNYFLFYDFGGISTIQGFNTANDVIVVASNDDFISSTVDGNDATLKIRDSSNTTKVILPGISSGTVKIKSKDNQYAGLITIGAADTVCVSLLGGE